MTTSQQQQPDTKAQKPFPFPTSDNHGKAPAEPAKPVEQPSSEEALDSGVEESFPASDPVSVTVTKVKLPSAEKSKEGDPGENPPGAPVAAPRP